MKTDRITKILLLVIACGLWMNIFVRGIGQVDAQVTTKPGVLKARRIELINSKGVVDATLVPASDYTTGNSGIGVMDVNDRMKAVIGTKIGGGDMSFFDADGNARAFISVAHGGGSLTFADTKNIPTTILSSANNAGSLTFYDSKGRPRIIVSSDHLGQGILLNDAKGTPRIDLSNMKSYVNIAVNDSNGNSRALLGNSQTVNKFTGAKTTTSESTITLFDTKGNVLYQRP